MSDPGEDSRREAVFHLGEDLEFRPREHQLLRAGRAVPLQPRTCDTLLYLVERAGRLVEKEELLDALWQESFVTENVLTRAIKEIRKALGDDARRPRFIQTVPRVGYRFVAKVERRPAAAPTTTPGPGGPVARLSPWIRGLAAALLAAVLLAMLLWVGRDSPGAGSKGSERADGDRRMMLVVLPFDNLGAPEDAYFAAGMTDELTSRLARVRSLGVISRSSAQQYAGARPSLVTLREELGVDYVIAGTVRWDRIPGGRNRVRITPRLERVADRTQLWSGTFDRDLEDVFAIQAEIAARVIAELDLALPAVAADAPTANFDAYRAWLKGLDQWYVAGFDLERFDLAASLFERAADLDPRFLEPLVTLVHVHGVAYNARRDPERRAAMERALARAEALAPEAAEVDLARCAWLHYAEADHAAAFARCQAASRALPNNPQPLEMMAYIRRRQGRAEETVELLEQVLVLSPRDAHTLFELALTLDGLRRFDEADVHLESASRLEPDNVQIVAERAGLRLRWRGDLEAALAIAAEAPSGGAAGGPMRWLDFVRRDWAALTRHFEERALRPGDLSSLPYDAFARAYAELGESERAEHLRRVHLEAARKEAASTPGSLDAQLDLASAASIAGHRSEALAAVETASGLIAANRFLAPLADEVAAFVYAQLGEPDAALDRIERLLELHYQRPLTIPLLEVHPDWDPLRGNPRFERLVTRPH